MLSLFFFLCEILQLELQVNDMSTQLLLCSRLSGVTLYHLHKIFLTDGSCLDTVEVFSLLGPGDLKMCCFLCIKGYKVWNEVIIILFSFNVVSQVVMFN